MKSEKILGLSFIILFCSFTFQVVADSGSEKAAINAAKEWLFLVDTNEYGKSWDEASEFFKKSITKKLWVDSIKGTRPSFGDLISRTLKSAVYATSLPGAPDGEYVVIQFSTSFANKKSAIETITPMKDPDGLWRVSGYYIK
jgi:hypothetical protein